ncbi:MAG TPA: ABC transporter ATP-binding protein [Casimicrobiaceae bacterium]|jgi:iron(III) transport system ATP-binding protein
MARLSVEGVTKTFGAFRALDQVSLDVRDGEFMAILGASGCGKTTLLRQIAGFDKLDGGRIVIGETVVSTPTHHVPPERRRIGIVFQSYALWPHMTVAENVAYGLTVQGVREPERARRVEAALALVELEGFAARRPSLLSGGQRQRVALARCLVTEPSLVLLDEPLANLDVHLRASMEDEFARFHARTGTTMLYITHDQAEAMALADRIAVMDCGRLLQVATPSQLYREPADPIVATFIGEGIVVPAEVVAVDGRGGCRVDLFGLSVVMRCTLAQQRARSAHACLRANNLAIVGADAPGVGARVVRTIYQGGHFRVEAELDHGDAVLVHLTAAEPCRLETGSAIRLGVEGGWILPETGQAADPIALQVPGSRRPHDGIAGTVTDR